MPSTRSSSMPKVWLSSTVMTPSVPTFSSDSAIIAPTSLSAAEMAATLAICAWSVLTLLLSFLIDSTAASTAFSMPPLSTIGFAPAATLRRPSRTIAQARTVAVVVPSPATSSVFLATSLTSSAPIFSKGSSRSISLAMETPSFVIVGAPHFFSRTTLRPLGPSVTRTASASWFMPRSRPRRASSSKAMILAMRVDPPGRGCADRPGARDGCDQDTGPGLVGSLWHSARLSATSGLALSYRECKPPLARDDAPAPVLQRRHLSSYGGDVFRIELTHGHAFPVRHPRQHHSERVHDD